MFGIRTDALDVSFFWSNPLAWYWVEPNVSASIILSNSLSIALNSRLPVLNLSSELFGIRNTPVASPLSSVVTGEDVNPDSDVQINKNTVVMIAKTDKEMASQY